ncbi:hypothetical protein AX14_013152 [Amanita brunnescens Koide BX004]|nr:hypothetical protein AX14_013152 [Amanita brunnescens Koide BX004]
MAASCPTTPTLTQTIATTTQSTSTIVSSSVTTSSPTTTFITSVGTTCFPRIEGTPLCQTTTQVTNSTIPGATQTVEITQTTVFPVTTTVVNTLYATSCTVINSGGSKSTVTSTSSSSSSSIILPSLSTMTSMSSSTAADGSVYITPVTETQTIFPTSSSGAGAQNSNTNTTTSTSNLGAIIGGSVGGFFGLAAVALLAWYLWKRNHNWDDIFEREEDTILRDVFPKPKRDPPLDPEPKPYQYGLVGRAAVPPHMSPPSSSAGLSLSSDAPNAYPPAHNVAPHHQHLAGQHSGVQQQQQVAQQQQSVVQQQWNGQQQSQQQMMQQQQSVVQQQWNGQQQPQQVAQQQQSVVQQQWNVQQQPQQSVMPQQQSMGPQAGQGAGQPQIYGQLPSLSSNSHASHAIAAASIASLSPRPSAAVSLISSLQDGSSTISTPPGVWGGGRYPPGTQRNLSATASATQSRPGTGQRESVFDENEVYGGIVTDAPIVGHSGAATHGPAAGVSNTGPGSNSAEFNPYQELQRPIRERRDGKGRLITTGEKPPVIHLDGDRYREQARSPASTSFGRDSVIAPPAYSV